MADQFLARFRADPSKLRVSIRRMRDREGAYWRAMIELRATGRMITAAGRTAIRALVRTFQAAERDGMPGIDRHMDWAYEHPQGALAQPERVSRVPTPKRSEGK